MKKLTTLLFAVTLLVGFSSVTMAQSTATETISAKANVVQDMVVGNDTNDIEFNNILRNSGKSINAVDGTVDATAASTSGTVNGVTGGEARGWFDISIVAGTSVDLSLAVPPTLAKVGGGDFLNFSVGTSSANIDLNGLITETKPTGNTEVTAITNGAGSDFSFDTGDWTLGTAFEMPEGGTVYLALGGEVFATHNQALGSYAGDITLTATVAD